MNIDHITHGFRFIRPRPGSPVTGLVIPAGLAASVRALGPAGQRWLDGLPALLAGLAADWGLSYGTALAGAAAYVTEAVTAAGELAVLKVALPSGVAGFAPFGPELTALVTVGGDPYARVLRHDADRRAVLLERLGPSLASLRWPPDRQLAAIVATVRRGWRPVPPGALPDGGTKASWLAGFVPSTWHTLGEPCPERVIAHAVDCATVRAARFDPGRAVLVHGDAHPGNLLTVPGAPGSFRLVDPEGLASEPAHDLGVTLRDWNQELLAGDTVALAVRRCAQTASLTGTDPAAVWQWSCAERVSTGLFLLYLGHEAQGRPYLEVAARLAAATPPWG